MGHCDEAELGKLTTEECAAWLSKGNTALLVPVGSVEPHGPHLPLRTDTRISEEACRRAVAPLRQRGIAACVAPSVPYGVTDFARGFRGALSVPAEALTAFLSAIVRAALADGVGHVCIVNNHLEPAHDSAVRAAVAGVPHASVACPLTRRWGRTLSEEFRRGNCHAGEYETSLALAAGESVRARFATLAEVETSLSDGIRSGKHSFAEMGLDQAYTGAPARASSEEGEALFEKLVAMVVGEVTEALEVHPRA